MTQYKIERWDGILVNNERVPAIYIKPDITFLKFISKNSNAVVANINNTQTNYDNKKFVGIVNQSSYYPNCRPNFFEQSGNLYIITLQAPWIGYPNPKNLGTVKFYGY